MEPQTDDTASFGFGLADLWGLARVHRNLMALVFLGAIVLVMGGTMLITPEYKSTATLHLTMPVGQEVGSTAEAVSDRMLVGRNVYVRTQIEIIKSEKLQQKVFERYGEAGYLPDPRVPSAASLLPHIGAWMRPETELVDVWVIHTDPQRAAALANLIAEVYREYSLDATRDAAQDARTWLEEQIVTYGERIEELDAAIVAYQREHDLPDAVQRVTALGAHLEALKQRLAATRTEATVLASEVEAHERMAKAGVYEELANSMGTPLVGALTNVYAEAMAKGVALAARYGEKHPERVAVQALFERIRDELQAEVERNIEADRATLQVLRATEAELAEDVATANATLLEQQSVRDGYDRMRAEIDRSKHYLTKLSQRKDELDMLARTQLHNARIIELAKPPGGPFRPDLVSSAAFATVLGLLAAIAAALLAEYLDDRLLAPEDIQRHLGVPYLGYIPTLPPEPTTKTPALFTHEYPNSVTTEAVRAVRTMVELGAGGTMPRRLLITSALPREGKTDTSARLAIAFAQANRRVLLIDADLYSPRQHRAFGIPDRDPGMVDLLGGAHIADVVRRTDVPGVDLVTAGSGGVHVKELLGSQRMEEILQEAEQLYDLVLLDTPPVHLTADPAILSRFVGGIVIVVRWQTAPRAVVRHAIGTLKKVGAPIVGVVLNATTGRAFRGNAYYSNRYPYRYGYGQSEDGDDAEDQTAAK
ncbi:MAG: polysaccharide biosynthesis tyrosine autokinase [Alphaproteobacteria bacterium]|nr:polysaccharide biosynthesis tyrosine autokinase [Alphaproteobacteria bacterium]